MTEDVVIALVLSGGGARGAYQVGVLRWIAEVRPDLPFQIMSGSSAGSVNVGYLASGADQFAETVEHLALLWAGLTVDRVYRTDVLSLSASGLRWLRDLVGGGRGKGPAARSLLDTAPLERLLRERLDFARTHRLIGRGVLHAVSVTATSYTTGQAVSFVEGDPEIRPWGRAHRIGVIATLGPEHVLASCAIPFLFPAVQIGDSYYGDGNVRLGNPFSPATKLGATRILAVSMRHQKNAREAGVPLVTGYPPPAQVAGVLLNSVFLDGVDDDAEQLFRVNALLHRCQASTDASTGLPPLRPIELLVVSPSRDLGRLARDFQHQFPPAVRWLLRGIGAGETMSSDLLSYLLFDRVYTQPLMELGYADAAARRGEILAFLDEALPRLSAPKRPETARDDGRAGRSARH